MERILLSQMRSPSVVSSQHYALDQNDDYVQDATLYGPGQDIEMTTLEHCHDTLASGERNLSSESLIAESRKLQATTVQLRLRAPWSERLSRWWIFELFAVVLSIALLIALVIVLLFAQGKEQGRWLYDTLTLNGLVALLTTLLRGCILASVAAALSQLKWNRFFRRSDQTAISRRLGDIRAFDDASRGSWGALGLLATFSTGL